MIPGLSPLDAVKTGLAATESLLGGAGAAGSSSAGVSRTAFSDLVAEAANRTIGTLNKAEQVSIQALQGEADTRAVVDAVMSAEQSLQAAIAIRDKIVTAYLEISRMSI